MWLDLFKGVSNSLLAASTGDHGWAWGGGGQEEGGGGRGVNCTVIGGILTLPRRRTHEYTRTHTDLRGLRTYAHMHTSCVWGHLTAPCRGQ